MSTEIISIVVLLASALLPKIGVSIDQNALASTAATIVTIVSGLWLWYQRYKRGGINVVGIRK